MPFNVIILKSDGNATEIELAAQLEKIFKSNESYLAMAQIRRVSVAFPNSIAIEDSTPGSTAPAVYTFRHRTAFREDPIVRHLEAPLAYQLELTRLSNYNVKLIPTHTRQVHLYEGAPKEAAVDAAGLKGARKNALMSRSRYFARARLQVRSDDSETPDEEKLFAGVERMLVEELNVSEQLQKTINANKT